MPHQQATEYSQKTYQEATALMWVFYKENKYDLIADVSEQRNIILEKLMTGQDAKTVFSPYFLPAEVFAIRKKMARQRINNK